MYQIECLPGVNEAYCSRFDKETDAVEAARSLAEKHKVQVNVLKVIKRFRINVVEEEI